MNNLHEAIQTAIESLEQLPVRTNQEEHALQKLKESLTVPITEIDWKAAYIEQVDLHNLTLDELYNAKQDTLIAEHALQSAKRIIESRERRQLSEAVVIEAKTSLGSEREANAQLTNELAASQAREKVLKTHLESLIDWASRTTVSGCTPMEILYATAALNMFTDDTALRGLLKAAHYDGYTDALGDE